ncbi:lactate/malate family dehydrogenase [Agathobacter sp.]
MGKFCKVGIIGAGHVGIHVASMLLSRNICNEIVLIDIDQEKAKGQATDLADIAAYQNSLCKVYAGDYDQIADASYLVVNVGGKLFDENRLEEWTETKKIVDEIAPKIQKSGFKGTVVSITNPCDLVAYYLNSKIDAKVIGSGTMLDSARFRRRLADELNVNVNSVQAWCMGEHGDSQVLVWSKVYINGILLEEYIGNMNGIDLSQIKKTVTKSTVYAGWEIASAKGSTEFGIGMAASELIKNIEEDSGMILPCSVLLNGEYNQKDVYASVLCYVDSNGAKPLNNIVLAQDELNAFIDSCNIIRKYLFEG